MKNFFLLSLLFFLIISTTLIKNSTKNTDKKIFEIYQKFSKNFKKLDKQDFKYSECFNPNRIQTNREKYVIFNKIDIFERIYLKI